MRFPLNITNHEPHDIITIAHRGGVVGEGAHENSRLSIQRAIERGYDMVELDVMSTTDHHPILVHGAWVIRDTGSREPAYLTEFRDKSLSEAEKERHPWNGETVMTLAEGLDVCRGRLGVMLDIKTHGEPLFYERIADAVEEHGFSDKTVALAGRNHAIAPYLAGKCLFTVGLAELDGLANEGDPGRPYYGFSIPDQLPGEALRDDVPTGFGVSEHDVERYHALGLPFIVAINRFRYSVYPDAEQRHQELARRDIARFRQAGADGFQIDSVYNGLVFGE